MLRSGSIQHIGQQALALWAEAGRALAISLPGVLLLSEMEGSGLFFNLMHFSTGEVLLTVLFLLTKYRFNGSNGHYFMSGKM